MFAQVALYIAPNKCHFRENEKFKKKGKCQNTKRNRRKARARRGAGATTPLCRRRRLGTPAGVPFLSCCWIRKKSNANLLYIAPILLSDKRVWPKQKLKEGFILPTQRRPTAVVWAQRVVPCSPKKAHNNCESDLGRSLDEWKQLLQGENWRWQGMN